LCGEIASAAGERRPSILDPPASILEQLAVLEPGHRPPARRKTAFVCQIGMQTPPAARRDPRAAIRQQLAGARADRVTPARQQLERQRPPIAAPPPPTALAKGQVFHKQSGKKRYECST